MNPLQRLVHKLRNKLVHGGPEGQRTCIHGSDPRTCFDCSYWRGVAKEQAYNRHVYAHDTAETLPAELGWVERLNDAYTPIEDEGVGS